MAIKARLTGYGRRALNGIYYDPITDTSFINDTISDDLTGLDCRNVLGYINKGLLELTEGSLGPYGLTDTLLANGSDAIDVVATANRSSKKIQIYNTGTGVLRIRYNSDTTQGITLRSGTSFTLESPVWISTLELAETGGANPVIYDIVIE